MADRYENDGDWRRDSWWQHDQNPGQGFSAWRGDSSDPEWHQRPYGRGDREGWRRNPGYGRGPRGRDEVREDYDRDYGQDFGGGRAYGYGRRDYVRGRDDFIRYDAFAADWDYAGSGSSPGLGDSSRLGRHAGRGPKGYRRSDERIREDINDLLTADPHIDASDIEVRVATGVVTLAGVVDDRSAKRYAEDLAERVRGVDDVNNQLKVRRGLLSGMHPEQGGERELSREPSRELGTTAATSGPARKTK